MGVAMQLPGAIFQGDTGRVRLPLPKQRQRLSCRLKEWSRTSKPAFHLERSWDDSEKRIVNNSLLIYFLAALVLRTLIHSLDTMVCLIQIRAEMKVTPKQLYTIEFRVEHNDQMYYSPRSSPRVQMPFRE
ncbi:hypothetical protein FPOAC2_04014 [Fusarium poae]|jgi:hypothetical protein